MAFIHQITAISTFVRKNGIREHYDCVMVCSCGVHFYTEIGVQSIAAAHVASFNRSK